MSTGDRDTPQSLDAGPRGGEGEELRARRAALVSALAASGLRRDLTATEDAVLGWAIDAVTTPRGRAPTLIRIERTISVPVGLTEEQRQRLADIAERTPVTLAIAPAHRSPPPS